MWFNRQRLWYNKTKSSTQFIKNVYCVQAHRYEHNIQSFLHNCYIENAVIIVIAVIL